MEVIVGYGSELLGVTFKTFQAYAALSGECYVCVGLYVYWMYLCMYVYVSVRIIMAHGAA